MEHGLLRYVRCPIEVSKPSSDSTYLALALNGDGAMKNTQVFPSKSAEVYEFSKLLTLCRSGQTRYQHIFTLGRDGKTLFMHGIIVNINESTEISGIKSAICQTTRIPVYHLELLDASFALSTIFGEDYSNQSTTAGDFILFFCPESAVPSLTNPLGIILVTEYRCNIFRGRNSFPIPEERRDSRTLAEILLCISSSQSLSSVKEIVALATATPYPSIELSFAGRVLEDDQKTVEEYCISDGSVIRMKLRNLDDMQSSSADQTVASRNSVQIHSLDDAVEEDKTSFSSKKSIKSFLTDYSSSVSQAFFSARSRATKDGPPVLRAPSKFLTTIKERGLLSKPEEEIDWSGKGQHVEYERDEDVNLKLGEVVGWSSTAVVTGVTCRRIKLARKTMQCRRMKLDDALCEVAHLQKLSDPHVVQLIGTYLQDSKFSILLYPLAEWDLGKFLRLDHNRDSYRLRFLENATVCLLRAVEYIHQQTIRHMDIKPSNILIKCIDQHLAVEHRQFYGFRVLLADFDIAYDFRYDEGSKTEGNRIGTPTYRSPEAFRGQVRGRKSDIFSLGCVFAEILTVRNGRSLDDFEAYWQNHNDNAYHSSLNRVHQWLAQEVASEVYHFPFDPSRESVSKYFEKVRKGMEETYQTNSYDSSEATVYEYIEKWEAMTEMLSLDPDMRPTALELLQRQIFGDAAGCQCKRLPLIREG